MSKISFDGSLHLRASTDTRTKMIVAQPGDLLVSGINAAKGAICLNETSGAVAATIHYSAYEVDAGIVDPHYLLLLLRSGLFRDLVIRSVPGGIKTELKPKRLLQLEVDLPDQQQQQSVLERARRVHQLLSQAERNAERVRHLLAELRSQIVTHALVGHSPDGTLADVLAKKPRNGWSPKCDNSDSGTPVLSLGAVTGWTFRPEHLKTTAEPTNDEASYWVSDGDLLVTRSNTEELVGHAAIARGLPDRCIYPDLMMKLTIDEAKASKEFVYYWLMSGIARDHVRASAKGSNPTMKKINQKTLMSTPFPTALNYDRQIELVGVFDQAMSRLVTAQRANERSASNMKQLRTSLNDSLLAEVT